MTTEAVSGPSQASLQRTLAAALRAVSSLPPVTEFESDGDEVSVERLSAGILVDAVLKSYLRDVAENGQREMKIRETVKHSRKAVMFQDEEDICLDTDDSPRRARCFSDPVSSCSSCSSRRILRPGQSFEGIENGVNSRGLDRVSTFTTTTFESMQTGITIPEGFSLPSTLTRGTGRSLTRASVAPDLVYEARGGSVARNTRLNAGVRRVATYKAEETQMDLQLALRTADERLMALTSKFHRVSVTMQRSRALSECQGLSERSISRKTALSVAFMDEAY